MITQSVDSPNLKLRIEACSRLPVGWGSVGGLRGTKAGQAWGPCSKQHTPTGRPALGVPAPRPEIPTTFSLRPETSGEEVHTGHRLLRSKRKGPWPLKRHCSPTVRALGPAISSPLGGGGGCPRGPQPWPTTVMSLPLFPDPSLEGFSRTTHPIPTPFLLGP